MLPFLATLRCQDVWFRQTPTYNDQGPLGQPLTQSMFPSTPAKCDWVGWGKRIDFVLGRSRRFRFLFKGNVEFYLSRPGCDFRGIRAST
eukprot:scaffold261_cov336-Pavlova_lutheri.AAC.22